MRLIISISYLIFLSACYTQLENPIVDFEFTGSELVVSGVITSEGGQISVTKTLPPNLPYFPSDVQLEEPASVSLFADGSAEPVHQLSYAPDEDLYYLSDSLATDKTYRLEITAEGFPTAQIESLTFVPSLTETSVGFRRRQDNPSTDVTIRTKYSGDTYHFVQALFQDIDTTTMRNPGLLYTDFDNIFLDQCGILSEFLDLAYSSACFGTDSAQLDIVHQYSEFTNDDNRFVRLDIPPNRIGVRVSSISQQDYNFLASLKRNQNLLDDYFVREPLTFTNVTGGYGYVLVARGEEFWIDL